jgi:uncharacterized membrane protein YbhN (UPF0104 family)
VSPGGGRGGRLKGALKTLLALALLAAVAWRLPWSDTALWVPDPAAPEATLEVRGEIVGSWRADRIEFVVAEGESLAGWPAELVAAVEAGGRMALSRAEPGARGAGWRPGMPHVFAGLEPAGLGLAFAALLAGVAFGVTRWWRILNLAGCPSSWGNTLRLAFLGVFFNLVFPGITGGDVPKALMVVREHPERRADALATVVLDRMVGVWALVLLATGVAWAGGESFAPLRLPALLALLAGTLGVFLVLVPGPRRALGIDRLLERLPQGERLKKLEVAAELYRGHAGELVGSVLLSLGNHLAVAVGVLLIGRALGDDLDALAYLAIVPVVSLVSALPISPGGWGVGEAAYGTLFQMMGAEAALGVAVSVTYRLCSVALGLFGGLFLLAPGGREVRREALEAAREAEESPGAD